MTKVRKIQRSENTWQYHFVCPACNQEHAFNEIIWNFNQDFDKPTISPSYLLEGSRFDDASGKSILFRCHSFIRDGKIQYLDDCTHHLKGQTVDLPENEY